jgi:hypothetical protein
VRLLFRSFSTRRIAPTASRIFLVSGAVNAPSRLAAWRYLRYIAGQSCGEEAVNVGIWVLLRMLALRLAYAYLVRP